MWVLRHNRSSVCKPVTQGFAHSNYSTEINYYCDTLNEALITAYFYFSTLNFSTCSYLPTRPSHSLNREVSKILPLA